MQKIMANTSLNWCRICTKDCQSSTQRSGVGLVTTILCESCGHYELGPDEQPAPKRAVPEHGYHLVAAVLRRRWERTKQPLPLAEREQRQLPSDRPEIPVTERSLRAIDVIAERSTGLDSQAQFNPLTDWPLFAARHENEFNSIVEELITRQLVAEVGSPTSTARRVRLLTLGWEVAESRGETRPVGKQVFVAMSFAPKLAKLYDRAIRPGIEDGPTGYKAIRVDRLEHNEKVCDRILAEIRRSSLMVADFTGHRQGVYFEAGFAVGLGIPVIWTCKQSHMKEAHFDTRQYNHIAWSDPDDLRERLGHRIQGQYPMRS